MVVRVINNSQFDLPEYATINSAAMDLRANLTEPVKIKPLGRAVIPTGLFVEIPSGYQMEVRPRSGLAVKHGITVLNSPGTIDSDYRGEIMVILVNLSENEFFLTPGERIAQLLMAPTTPISWSLTDELSATTRGDGGFGSTGRR